MGQLPGPEISAVRAVLCNCRRGYTVEEQCIYLVCVYVSYICNNDMIYVHVHICKSRCAQICISIHMVVFTFTHKHTYEYSYTHTNTCMHIQPTKIAPYWPFVGSPLLFPDPKPETGFDCEFAIVHCSFCWHVRSAAWRASSWKPRTDPTLAGAAPAVPTVERFERPHNLPIKIPSSLPSLAPHSWAEPAGARDALPGHFFPPAGAEGHAPREPYLRFKVVIGGFGRVEGSDGSSGSLHNCRGL